MNILSLFDGMSCGQIAINRLGINYDNYFASEIDKHAIYVTQYNYPNTIQIGDVSKVSYKDGILYTENNEYNIGRIDLLMGGTPCQNLSKSVINNSSKNGGLKGDSSKLFFEYYRLLKEINPKYFLLENVASMKGDDYDIITELMNSNSYRINSNLFTAQDRDRYYWTNIGVDMNIHDKNIILKDIVLPYEDVPNKYIYICDYTYNGDVNKVQATLHINGHDILKRVYNINGKCGTLTKVSGGNHQKKVFQNGHCRKLLPIEYERLQTVEDNYTLTDKNISDTQRYNMLGNGWTVDVIVHILKNMNR